MGNSIVAISFPLSFDAHVGWNVFGCSVIVFSFCSYLSFAPILRWYRWRLLPSILNSNDLQVWLGFQLFIRKVNWSIGKMLKARNIQEYKLVFKYSGENLLSLFSKNFLRYIYIYKYISFSLGQTWIETSEAGAENASDTRWDVDAKTNLGQVTWANKSSRWHLLWNGNDNDTMQAPVGS